MSRCRRRTARSSRECCTGQGTSDPSAGCPGMAGAGYPGCTAGETSVAAGERRKGVTPARAPERAERRRCHRWRRSRTTAARAGSAASDRGGEAGGALRRRSPGARTYSGAGQRKVVRDVERLSAEKNEDTKWGRRRGHGVCKTFIRRRCCMLHMVPLRCAPQRCESERTRECGRACWPEPAGGKADRPPRTRPAG